MKTILLSLLMISTTFVTALGQQTWKADQAHSRIGFNIEHMVISEVKGQFSDFDITVTTKDDSFKNGEVNAEVQVKSIDTGVEKRDNHLKSGDFFDAEKYPVMTFKSTSFQKVNDKNYKLKGDLTIHGVTKPVILDVIYNGTIKDPYGKTRAGFKVTGKINRYDYGLKWNSVMEAGGAVVGEEVEIVADLEFVKQ